MISIIRDNFKPYAQIWPMIALTAAGYEKQLLYYRNKNNIYQVSIKCNIRNNDHHSNNNIKIEQ